MHSPAMETNQQRHAAYRGLHANVSTVAVAFITLITGQPCCGKKREINSCQHETMGTRWNSALQTCSQTWKHPPSINSCVISMCKSLHNSIIDVDWNIEWTALIRSDFQNQETCVDCKAVLALRAYCLSILQFTKPVKIALQCEASVTL